MYVNFSLNEDQVKRLKLAKHLRNWGHLETWRELCAYQIFGNDSKSVKEIGDLARRRNFGFQIELPYNPLPVKKYLIKAILKRLYKLRERKEVEENGRTAV